MAEDPNDSVFFEIEKLYMPDVLKGIRARALALANLDNRDQLTPRDAFRAFEETFGDRKNVSTLKGHTAGELFRENLFLIIVVSMTIVFGLMGLAPYIFSVDASKLAYKPDVFIDIAKLFAGVVVGGAAGAAVGAAGTKNTRGRD